jgi:hypothetical protein
MNRTQKRFLQKIAKPVLIPAAALGTCIIIHYIATLFGYTLQHVIAYSGIVLVYLIVPLLILGVWLWYVADKILEKWQEAKLEVAEENQYIIKVIRND